MRTAAAWAHRLSEEPPATSRNAQPTLKGQIKRQETTAQAASPPLLSRPLYYLLGDHYSFPSALNCRDVFESLSRFPLVALGKTLYSTKAFGSVLMSF